MTCRCGLVKTPQRRCTCCCPWPTRRAAGCPGKTSGPAWLMPYPPATGMTTTISSGYAQQPAPTPSRASPTAARSTGSTTRLWSSTCSKAAIRPPTSKSSPRLSSLKSPCARAGARLGCGPPLHPHPPGHPRGSSQPHRYPAHRPRLSPRRVPPATARRLWKPRTPVRADGRRRLPSGSRAICAASPTGSTPSYLQLAARCGRAPDLADALDAHRLPKPLVGAVGLLAVSAAPPHPHRPHRSVNAVAVAELDGRPVVVSGGDDATVRVWDLATGAPVGDPFTGHTGWVTAVAVAELRWPPGGGLRRRRRHGAGVGPGHRHPGRRPVHRPHRRGDRGGGGGAGGPPGGHLRRRRWHGAGVGAGHRHPGRRPVHRPHRLGERGGGGGAGRPAGGGLRQRRWHGAGMGPGHRRPGRRPVHRPHRRGECGGGRRSWTAARW